MVGENIVVNKSIIKKSNMETNGPTEPAARMKKLLEFDNIDFWLVSGNIVHKEFDQSWKNSSNEGEFMGGHHYVFGFIPENEIWVSNLDKETDCTMVHEYVERLLMKENHLSYEKSHRVATATEGIYRGVGHKCEKR